MILRNCTFGELTDNVFLLLWHLHVDIFCLNSDAKIKPLSERCCTIARNHFFCDLPERLFQVNPPPPPYHFSNLFPFSTKQTTHSLRFFLFFLVKITNLHPSPPPRFHRTTPNGTPSAIPSRSPSHSPPATPP